MTIRQMLLVTLVFLGGMGGAFMMPTQAAALTCPDTPSANMPRSATLLSELYSGATDSTAVNRLGELVADLRKSGMKPALIVDHLVSGYCPLVVADGSLSDKQKTDRIRRFAQLVTGLVYAPPEPGEEDILVQAALAPDLLSQIDQVARQSGMSRDEWIEQAIKQKLAQP